jgi:glutathione S-transferase
MTLEVYWGSGSPFSWRVLLALEFKRLKYLSHELDLARLEHKSPQMLALNPRGRVPVLKDGDYVCYESLAILMYLERKYPRPALFGRTAEEAGTVMRFICEYQLYAEEHITKIITAIYFQSPENRIEEIKRSIEAMNSEARKLDQRLGKHKWLVGDLCSAADLMIFPGIKLLLRALQRREAEDLQTPFTPLEENFPGIAAWMRNVEALPGYDSTYPPHWRE